MAVSKLELDEAQRTANYEAIKSNVKTEVGGAIVSEATRPTSASQEHIDSVAEDIRQKSVNEVVGTQSEIERGRILARVSQVIDYVFFVIYGLLGIRLILELFAANNSVGFVQVIKTVTEPLYAPFKGIVPSLTIGDGFTLALPIVIAIVVYALFHLAINGFLRIFVHRKTTV
ncbi:MAG TPA: YggT family protein [Pyrinomonadaceae bacterium]|nr:YggT family protein [Pyrinomonadaceae bacterium]